MDSFTAYARSTDSIDTLVTYFDMRCANETSVVGGAHHLVSEVCAVHLRQEAVTSHAAHKALVDTLLVAVPAAHSTTTTPSTTQSALNHETNTKARIRSSFTLYLRSMGEQASSCFYQDTFASFVVSNER